MPTYAKNKKALFDYEVLEKIEAGLVLKGHEVKAIRQGSIQLKGAYISDRNTGLYLVGAHIGKYRYAGNIKEYDPERPKKLLVSKKEMTYLRQKLHESGLTIVPLGVYTKGPHIKLEIAIVRGKKKYDKRESIKKRELKREAQRLMKG